MMKLLLILIFILLTALFYLLYPLYKERARQFMESKYIRAFITWTKKGIKLLKKYARIYYLRSETYAVFQDIRPY